VSIALQAHPLFDGVGAPAVERVREAVRLQTVDKATLLAQPGARRPQVLLVLDGYLHAYELTDDGGRVLFEVIGPGGIDGVLGMLGESTHFTEAATRATVAALEVSKLDGMLEAEAIVARNLVRLLAGRVSRREHQLAAVAIKNPSKRIAKQLLALADVIGDGDGDSVHLGTRITHQQLGDMLGIRRETATIHLHRLSSVGAVALDPRGMRLSRRRLRAVVDGRLPASVSSHTTAG
jgi:CRP/FNR family cyclic AMP-dependent transcriptional regulator